MINQTLHQAVENEILNVIVPTKSSFSFHDITVKIRERVNKGEIDITDCQDTSINGVKSRRISSDDVRECAQIVLRNNHLAGYKKQHTALPSGGGYFSWVYDTGAPVSSSIPVPSPVVPAMPVPVAITAPMSVTTDSSLFADDN